MRTEEFKKKFLSFHPKLYRIAFALTGSREDSEDLLQETYCKLWNQRDELENIENPEAYCITVLKHKCMDYLRSAQANRTEVEIESCFDLQSSVSPAKELEEKEKLKQVKKAIDMLPENQKQVVRLHSMAECSYEEIEEITGLSNNNIRTLLSRARKQIKDRIEKLYAP